MNSLKPIAIAGTVTLLLMLLLLTAYLLTKRHKSKLNADGKLKRSYAIWYAAIFLSGAKIIAQVLEISIEIIDNLIKIHPAALLLTLCKAIALVSGSAFICFVSCVFITKTFIQLILFKTNENEEMEDDHVGYFIIKSAMLIGMVFSLSDVISLLLRTFIPAIQIPYYH
ncbi:hypothetical protein [Pedobacter sp. ASV12]|uniref:hypothetical protein n=1 Tax=Pedobacter sp. ASV12 TaxID=2795120 RepID=UPI0018EBE6EE|nr:hypothetical protein [Pedobacter sp. ASV12]